MHYFLIALGAALLFVSTALVVAVPVMSVISRRMMRRVAAPFTDLGHPDPVEMIMAHPMVTEMSRLGRPMKVINVALVVVTGSLGIALLGAGTDRPDLSLAAATACAVGVVMTVVGYRGHVAGVERFAQAHGLEVHRGGRDDGDDGGEMFSPVFRLD